MGSEETKHSNESPENLNADGESAKNLAEVVSGEPAENSAEVLSSKSAETSLEANKPAKLEIPTEASKPPEGTTEASDPSEEAILTAVDTPETSKKKTPKPLKAKLKILKNPLAANGPSTNGKAKVVKRRKKKKVVKTALPGIKIDNKEEGVNKQTANNENISDQAEKGEKSGAENDNKHDEIAEGEEIEKSQGLEKTGESADKQQELKGGEKSGGPDTNGEKKVNGRKRKKDSLAEKRKKDKIDGMIFMCNKKTKPDCFRYGVMGVSIGKRDIVMGIKRGTKLFLYDFDHKILHGVYKATSRGDVKLEPEAFGGAFPAQVRFEMHKDCKPLPEAVFKKAIKENYYGNKKFNTELTFFQVKKLMTLFRPAEAHASVTDLSPPAAKPTTKTEDKGTVVCDKEVPTRDKGKMPRGKEAPARNIGTRKPEREPNSRSMRNEERRSRWTEKPRDTLRNGDSRPRHPPPPRERAHELRREANPRNLYLTEKEYRAYGLRGEIRRDLVPDFHPRVPDPPLADLYRRDYERDRLLRRRDIPGRADLTHPIDRDHRRSYSPVERRELAPLAPRASDPYASDPYYSRYFSEALPVPAPYLPLPRRDEIPSYSARARREDYLPEADPLRRRDEFDSLRRREELDSLRRREESDSLRRREESDSLRRREESDSLRKREESDSLRRREIDELDRLYSYGSEGYPGYLRRHEVPGLPASSSRYLDSRPYLSR